MLTLTQKYTGGNRMKNVSRRDAFLLGITGVLGLTGTAAAAAAAGKGSPDFLTRYKNDAFMKRDDIDRAMKSYYMSYDCTSPYPHKFNEVVTKWQLRSLQFHIDEGTEKELVEHYLSTMEPLLERIRARVVKDGPEKGLSCMFEGTVCQYQLFEHITTAPGVRSFPCPYKELLGHCKKYLQTFQIEWKDVCGRWCTPVWTGCADRIGIPVTIHPGDTCTVKLAVAEQKTPKE